MVYSRAHNHHQSWDKLLQKSTIMPSSSWSTILHKVVHLIVAIKDPDPSPSNRDIPLIVCWPKKLMCIKSISPPKGHTIVHRAFTKGTLNKKNNHKLLLACGNSALLIILLQMQSFLALAFFAATCQAFSSPYVNPDLLAALNMKSCPRGMDNFDLTQVWRVFLLHVR